MTDYSITSKSVPDQPPYFRCKVTGNPCGIDTTPDGKECTCDHCHVWFEAMRHIQRRIDEMFERTLTGGYTLKELDARWRNSGWEYPLHQVGCTCHGMIVHHPRCPYGNSIV